MPTLPEKASRIVLGMADMVLFCDMELQTGNDGQPSMRRVIRTKPSLYYEAGDRTGMLPETLDLDYSKLVAAFNVAAPSAPVKPASQKPTIAGR